MTGGASRQRRRRKSSSICIEGKGREDAATARHGSRLLIVAGGMKEKKTEKA